MRRLNELIDRVGEINLGGGGQGDLFPFLRIFFSRDEVKKKMIEFNQYQLFAMEKGNDDRAIGTYSPRTARRKVKEGLPSQDYTFYETGSFYASMGVDARDTEVEITSSTKGLGIDTARGHNAPIDMNHINYMMGRYNPTGSSLGLTDGLMGNVVEETKLVESLRDDINDFLNG